MDIVLIVLGLLFIIGSMVFFLNPPEAWVKKAFRRPAPGKKSSKPGAGPDEKR